MKTIGGNAKVVKKAVAPAIRNGSFSLSNRKEERRLVKNTAALLFFIWYTGMIHAKLCHIALQKNYFIITPGSVKCFFRLSAMAMARLKHSQHPNESRSDKNL